MKFNSSFPYPVLSMENDNYKTSTFVTTVEAQKSFGQLYLTLHSQLHDDVIERLIANGDAKYALHIECPQTSFRQIYQSENDKITASIADYLLRGKVDVHPFILASTRIENYMNPNLNDFYQSFPVTFEKGNILALGEAVEITLFEEEEESQNLPSIVTIRRVEKEKIMTVEMDSAQIIIKLPKEEYDQYSIHGNSRLKETVLTAVILPSLVDVFYRLKESSEDYAEYKWYQVLTHIFGKNHKPLSQIINGPLTPLEAAQMVLQNPLAKAFSEIKKFSETED